MNQKTEQTDKPFPRWFECLHSGIIRKFESEVISFYWINGKWSRSGYMLDDAEFKTHLNQWRELTQAEAEAILKK